MNNIDKSTEKGFDEKFNRKFNLLSIIFVDWSDSFDQAKWTRIVEELNT